ncbi:MAG: caspase family protein, partial [Cyanobacteria bacterium P01_D01_bin.115]
ESDRLNETLVCWDSRLPEGRDLADKELACLLAEVSAQGARITVILDCCHSGAGTRLINTRHVEPDSRSRRIEDYLPALRGNARSLGDRPTSIEVPQGRHVLLAACRDLQTAKEHRAKKRGVFSYFLLETLHQAQSTATYRDIFKYAQSLMAAVQVPDQTPQLEATDVADLDLPFLGLREATHSAGAAARRYFTVSHDATHGWVIDAGAVHGIPLPTADETTQLALFPFLDGVATQSAANAVTTAAVLEVLPQLSRIQIADSSSVRVGEVYRAIATSLPLARRGVFLTGEEAGVAALQQQLSQAASEAAAYIAEVPDADGAAFQVAAIDGRYRIADAISGQALVADSVGFEAAIAAQVVARLEHIARWLAVAELQSSVNTRIPANAVQFEILQAGQPLQAAPITLSYQYQAERWQQPTFQIRLTNTSDMPLYCSLLDLTERYAVSPVGFEAGGIWLQPGETAWVMGGKPLYASVPKELWQQGVTEYRDIFKLIVCTAEFDARLMAQGSLDAPRTRSAEVGRNARPSTLNRLMRRIQTREISAEPEDDTFLDDWHTEQITVITVRPQPGQVIPAAGGALSLGAEVMLQPHPELQAIARLTSLPELTRSLSQPTFPPILSPAPAASELISFTQSRGADPGLSVLELSYLTAHATTTVTPETPLQITLPISLAAGEYILPIAYDGEFFLPMGRSRAAEAGTDILLERLPASAEGADRSLGGAVRIFFQKILSHRLGVAFEYPQLAAIYLRPDQTAVYEKEVTVIRPQVAEAKRILLVIHGLLGDTPSMISDLQQDAAAVQSLRSQYDLILGFDYESFNTSIEETARQLKRCLEAIGLGAGHPKQLDIVGFELGGLVARWLIEREAGAAIANHLVLVGVPNGGTPWATLQAWATAALGIGLNSLSTVAWPVKVVGSLVAAIEAFDVTLDQMQPGSELLKSLAASPTHHVPYTVVGGDRSVPPAALLATAPNQSLLQRLFSKLFTDSTNLLFLGQANDLFASEHSLRLRAPERSASNQFITVACDHFTYFATPAGRQALMQALANNR